MPRPTLMRVAIFVVVVTATWAVLSLGTSVSDPNLEVGALASQEYRARQRADVIDVAATDDLKEQARETVEPIRDTNIETENLVRDQINALFDDVAALAVADEAVTTPTTLPEPPTTSAPG